MCRMSSYAFPSIKAKGVQPVAGFHTGDAVRAVVPEDKNTAPSVGRVAMWTSGYFNIATKKVRRRTYLAASAGRCIAPPLRLI